MNEAHILKIAGELKVQPWQIAATAQAFAEGATVHFTRYRKEATGSLDEVAIYPTAASSGEARKAAEALLGMIRKFQPEFTRPANLTERGLLLSGSSSNQFRAAAASA